MPFLARLTLGFFVPFVVGYASGLKVWEAVIAGAAGSLWLSTFGAKEGMEKPSLPGLPRNEPKASEESE